MNINFSVFAIRVKCVLFRDQILFLFLWMIPLGLLADLNAANYISAAVMARLLYMSTVVIVTYSWIYLYVNLDWFPEVLVTSVMSRVYCSLCGLNSLVRKTRLSVLYLSDCCLYLAVYLYVDKNGHHAFVRSCDFMDDLRGYLNRHEIAPCWSGPEHT